MQSGVTMAEALPRQLLTAGKCVIPRETRGIAHGSMDTGAGQSQGRDLHPPPPLA